MLVSEYEALGVTKPGDRKRLTLAVGKLSILPKSEELPVGKQESKVVPTTASLPAVIRNERRCRKTDRATGIDLGCHNILKAHRCDCTVAKQCKSAAKCGCPRLHPDKKQKEPTTPAENRKEIKQQQKRGM